MDAESGDGAECGVFLEFLEGELHDGEEEELVDALPVLELFVALVVQDAFDGVAVEV